MNTNILLQLPVPCAMCLYCGKWGKISKSCSDLDLDRTMYNVKLILDIFIYSVYNCQDWGHLGIENLKTLQMDSLSEKT